MQEKKAKWLSRSLIVGPYFALCTSEAEFKATMKHMKVLDGAYPKWLTTPQSDATTHFFDTNGGQLAAVVCIRVPDSVTSIQVAALLVHEAVHIWQRYCSWIGEDSPSDEFEAYSIQHIAQEFMTAYAEKLNKRGKQ